MTLSTFSAGLSARHILALTGTLMLVAAPHALRLPWWLVLLAAALVGWRLYLARTGLGPPHRAAVATIVLGTTGAIVLYYGTLWGRDAGVALLVTMLALKLLETKTRRDAMLIAFLCLFLVVTNFLYSQSIATALYMMVCVWIIVAGMIHLQHSRGAGPRELKLAGVMLAQSVPLMLVLFVLFPRIQGPLWGNPGDVQRPSTGLSDTMSPGALSNLALSDAVAFRASFTGRIPELKALYWRGPVLTDYDGMTWRAGPFGSRQANREASSPGVEYTVTVEAHGKPWLFALDLPAAPPPQSIITHDMQIVSSQPVIARTRYDMLSFLDGKYGRDERTFVLQRALRLPQDFNPKTSAFAREMRARHADDRALIQSVIKMFTQEPYVYTLSPPLLGQHGVDEFLFETRSGFCEHYASAFAVLMRAAGIPARVVTGYLGGEINPIGDYLIVRQADAHAWTEVWLEGEGWVRVDPTAAVAPARIEQGFGAGIDAAGAFGFFMRSDLPGLRHLRLTWDSISNGWNGWVLGYTFERQRALLTHAGLDGASWRTIIAVLFVATVFVVLALVLTTLQRLVRRGRDPVQSAYVAFCRKLARAGLPRAAHEGPLAFAERVSGARPDLEVSVRRFLILYSRLRYGRVPGTESIRTLRGLAREFNARTPAMPRSGRSAARRLSTVVAPAGSAARAATPEEL